MDAVSAVRDVTYYWYMHYFYSMPDRPFHAFRASKSGDRLTLLSSVTLLDGFWRSGIQKGSVGCLQAHVTAALSERI